jgi:hypothetical protein
MIIIGPCGFSVRPFLFEGSIAGRTDKEEEMKKYVILVAALLLIGGTAGAEGIYTALFVAEGVTPPEINCEESPIPYSIYSVRVWINNDITDGLKGCRFDIDSGPDLISDLTLNPEMPVIVGGDFVFPECRYEEWVWICIYSLFYTGTPHQLKFIPEPESGVMDVATCRSESFPAEELFAGNQFGVNQPAGTDSENSSWGAVKSLYR